MLGLAPVVLIGVSLNDQQIYILSIFDPTNYGNRLQACALETTVAALTGKDVVSVDCRRPIPKRGIAKVIADCNRTRIESKKAPVARRRRFRAFQTAHCAPVVEVAESEVCCIDAPVVIGSDQCWNPGWGLGASEFGAQCAVGVDRKMSYAASFGICISDMPEGWGHRYSEWLSEIENIGVREFEGARIVRELTGRSVKVVLDPTMLQTAEWWSEIEVRPIIPAVDLDRPFCLKYVLGDDSASVKIAERCDCDDLELVDLTDIHLPVGPAEFVWLIHHSSLVCTDSFHATVFSLLFHRRFVIYERQGNARSMSSRFDTLDTMFGINSNRAGMECFDECHVDGFDWEGFERVLAQKRNDSIAWLRDGLASL